MLPDILIIGGQKCGTTSLHEYLVQHRDVAAPRVKEVHYFDLNADRPLRWYRSHYPLRGAARHAIDSSPYYLFHPAVPRRAHTILPEARLIVLLRDPVMRAYSHYQHARRHGFETLDFEEAIAAEEGRLAGAAQHLLSGDDARSFPHQHLAYVSRSLYAPQIARWYEYFDPGQILIVSSEDLFREPARVLADVQSWLELPVALPDRLTPRHVGSYPPLGEELAQTLAQRFAEDRVALERLTGMTFAWSSAS